MSTDELSGSYEKGKRGYRSLREGNCYAESGKQDAQAASTRAAEAYNNHKYLKLLLAHLCRLQMESTPTMQQSDVATGSGAHSSRWPF